MSNEYKDWLNDEIKDFAIMKHNGQKRKYTGEPYINHPISLAQIIRQVCDKISETTAIDIDYINRLENVAYLHDTVEDTDATVEEIRERFGEYYASMTEWLTNISKPTDGNRSIRKKIDLDHILQAPVDAIIVKLADVYDNCKDLEKRDKGFAQVYFKEKRQFINALKDKHYVGTVENLIMQDLISLIEEVL